MEKEMTMMSNSALVSHTNISPNRNSPRNHAIDTITIHCVAGQCSVETLGNIFKPAERQASSNYGVGTDGRIGLYVEEKDRSWCTSSGANDHRAITIEVASDTTAPYAVNAKAYAALLDVMTDICRRNGIKKLLWKGDKSLIGHPDKQNMTVHRWFANKSCPGDYLYARHGSIADEVNSRLGSASTPAPAPESSDSKSVDDIALEVIRGDWGNGADRKNRLTAAGYDYAVLQARVNAILGGSAYATPAPALAFQPYTVKVTADVLNIRKGAGTNYATNGAIRNKGVYTIVEESAGQGATKWGRLKSGVGWISLDYVKRV
jgi:hypothetical protein